MKWLWFAAAAGLFYLAGVATGYARWHEPFDRYARDRMVILNRAEDAPTGGVILMGDSIVHLLNVPELCGLPVFNAGMSGARSDQIAPLVDPLIAKLKPRLVIMSAGTNDMRGGKDWRAAVEQVKRPGMVMLTPDDRLPDALLSDGVHPNAKGRAELKRRMESACHDISTKGVTIVVNPNRRRLSPPYSVMPANDMWTLSPLARLVS